MPLAVLSFISTIKPFPLGTPLSDHVVHFYIKGKYFFEKPYINCGNTLLFYFQQGWHSLFYSFPYLVAWARTSIRVVK